MARSRLGALGMGLLLLAVALAGCLAPPPAPLPGAAEPFRPGDPGVPLPDPVGLEGGEVVARGASNATLRWQGAVGGLATPLAEGEAAEAALTLPGGVALRIQVGLAWAGAGALRLDLLDSTGSTQCLQFSDPLFLAHAPPAVVREGRLECGVGRLPAQPAARDWTVRVASLWTRGEVPFEVEVVLDAFAPDPPHALARVEPFAVEVDGATLRGHTYIPEGPGPFPTILAYSPYWDAPSAPTEAYAWEVDGLAIMRGTLGFGALLAHGYAVALVSVRGTGASDGCYQYMNQPRNGLDANAVIDALAAQPWSDGNVGMYGISYLAATQLAAVAAGPSPHLKAIVPVSGEWDEWNMLGSYGAAHLGSLVHPAYRNRQQGLGVTLHPAGPQVGVGTVRPHHWCEDTPDPEVAHALLAVDGDKKGWFAERDLRSGLHGKAVPTLATFGLGPGEGHILQVNGVWDVLPRPRRLMVGPWDHQPPSNDWQGFARAHALPWFDHHLRGGAPVPADRVDYQDDAGTWRTAPAWPPPGTEVRLHLAPGRLVEDPREAERGEVRLLNDDTSGVSPNDCGPEALAHSAVFATPALAERVVLAGDFRVHLTLASTAPNGNLAAALWASEGEVACAAPVQPLEARRIQLANSDLRHRGHLETGEDFPVGPWGEVELTSRPFVKVVPAGARLLLVVAAGTGGFVPKPHQPVLTLRLGEEPVASVSFTVVEGTLRFQEDAGPATGGSGRNAWEPAGAPALGGPRGMTRPA